ncbi:single-stranded DNA-binding protein [Caproiciproducens sp. NJN-50]|uniref:single-stranded DNA-binding protein n=1 Tax=Caproiciproducens sp. NJN-50 TaxID=2507162 RepID=UPI000FFE2FB0|nr:single-stranded DNA-binding protein [Caproiciproducens sp. NJN-50]QAT48561.1 single-stranded DNA-binding protein [Caproiciproducens sp. NJN-50]
MLNSVNLQGRFIATPELRHTPNGISVTSFSLANDIGYGEKKKTAFIDCVAWRGTAELICKWFQKGDMVIVQGFIQTRTYTDKDGNKRKAVEIVADAVHFAEPKRDRDSNSGNKNTYEPAHGSADIDAGEDMGDFEETPVPDDLPF